MQMLLGRRWGIRLSEARRKALGRLEDSLCGALKAAVMEIFEYQSTVVLRYIHAGHPNAEFTLVLATLVSTRYL